MSRLLKFVINLLRSLFQRKRLMIPDDLDDVTPALSDEDLQAIPEKITSRDGLVTAPHAAPPIPPMFDRKIELVISSVPLPTKSEPVLDKPLSPLFFDTYGGDYNMPEFKKIASDHNFYGIIVKATEGLHYSPSWFTKHWDEIKKAAPERYGFSWFRGAYCYLKFNLSGKEQADYYLNFIEKAGGWDVGDIWPIADCERGHEGGVNWLAKRQQVIDVTSAWSERVKQVLGRQVMLYGNGIMRDLQIQSRMGCEWLWIPRYTAELPAEIYTRSGWTKDRLFAWQYSGDSESKLKGYPASGPLGKHGDLSVLIMEGGIQRLREELIVKP